MNFQLLPQSYGDESVGRLHNRFNESILIHHVYRKHLKELVEMGQVDTLIIEPEDGFSLLGSIREYLSMELGLPQRDLLQWVREGMSPDFEPNISSLADWLRGSDPDVTLIGIPSRIHASMMKGVVLVPYEDSICYKRFAQPIYNKPYRDFFYNVTYEALYYAYQVLGARNIAISHLAAAKYGRSGYSTDITYSQVDAVLHFCDAYRGVKQITFWDFEPGNHPLDAFISLTSESDRGAHREIDRVHENHQGMNFITLNWPLPANHNSSTSTSSTRRNS